MGIHVVHSFKTFLIDQLNNNLLFNLKRVSIWRFCGHFVKSPFHKERVTWLYWEQYFAAWDALSPVICGQLLLACVKHTTSAFSRNMCQKSWNLLSLACNSQYEKNGNSWTTNEFSKVCYPQGTLIKVSCLLVHLISAC